MSICWSVCRAGAVRNTLLQHRSLLELREVPERQLADHKNGKIKVVRYQLLFREGRFKSRPLLDEAAILASIAFIDQNPERARIAETPEESDITSVQDRIVSARPGGSKSKLS